MIFRNFTQTYTQSFCVFVYSYVCVCVCECVSETKMLVTRNLVIIIIIIIHLALLAFQTNTFICLFCLFFFVTFSHIAKYLFLSTTTTTKIPFSIHYRTFVLDSGFFVVVFFYVFTSTMWWYTHRPFIHCAIETESKKNNSNGWYFSFLACVNCVNVKKMSFFRLTLAFCVWLILFWLCVPK